MSVAKTSPSGPTWSASHADLGQQAAGRRVEEIGDGVQPAGLEVAEVGPALEQIGLGGDGGGGHGGSFRGFVALVTGV